MLLVALLLLFVNVMLLVPVLPAVAGTAAGSSGAGLATAAFFFPAVAAQLAAPRLLDRFPAKWVLALSLLLTGLPCFSYGWGSDSLAALLAATLVRGAGFGAATVACGTLVAGRAPAERLGAVVGYAGLAAGIPPVFAPATGIWLFEHRGADVVFVAAGIAGGAAALAALALADEPSARSPRRSRLVSAMVAPPLRRPLVWFGLVNVTRGAVISFVPLVLLGAGFASAGTFLLLFGTLAYLARWASGRIADLVGPRFVVLPAVLASLAGLVLLALDHGPAAVAAAAMLYGAGNGALMTSAQLVMLSAARDGRFAVPTAAWNVALDCGFGLGGLFLGFIAVALGYGPAFWLLPCIMAVVLAVVVREPERRRSATDV